MKAIKKAIIGSIGKAVNPLFSGSTPPPASGALWDYSIAGNSGSGFTVFDASGFGTKTVSGVGGGDPVSSFPGAAIDYAVQVGSYFQITVNLDDSISGVSIKPNVPSPTSLNPDVPQALQVTVYGGDVIVGDNSGQKYTTTPPKATDYTYGIEILSDSVVFHDLLNNTTAVATTATMGPLSISMIMANIYGGSASATFDDDPALPSTVQAGTVTMANQSIQDLVEDANYTNPDLRYFRLNEGTTDYISIPLISLSGAYEIEIDFYSSAGDGLRMLVSGTTGYYFYVNGANRSIRVGNLSSTVAVFENNELNTLKVVSPGTTGVSSVYLNGTLLLTGTINQAPAIDKIGSYTSGFRFDGILANLKVIDAGTLIRSYAIDDNDDNVVDTVNGQNGTVINGNSADWGSFTKSGNTWTGNNLTVPPWASSDQQLPIVQE